MKPLDIANANVIKPGARTPPPRICVSAPRGVVRPWGNSLEHPDGLCVPYTRRR
jgi:hypothetical protein